MNRDACAVVWPILAAMCAASFCATASGRTIYVDHAGGGDFTTIQAAIIDANDGDTIIVRDGTYRGADNRDIILLGKAITLRGENGAQNCFIDCEGKGRGFLVRHGEGPDSVIEGFTITNGSADRGGGILCDGASPMILNCIISENEADHGGGISIKDSGGTILKNCVIAQNICKIWGCGGIECTGADAEIINCTIAENASLNGPGGVSLLADSNATITNSILWGDSPIEIYVSPDSLVSMTYSDIQNGWPGEGNIDADPQFGGLADDSAITGLVSRWRFDEGGGQIAYDSANDNDGEIYGAQWAEGAISSALRFDGIDDYVLVNNHPTLDMGGKYTFSVWIFKEGDGRTILSEGGIGPEPYDGAKLYAEDDLSIQFENRFGGPSTEPGAISLNTWHHIAVSRAYDASPEARIYIDGIEAASADGGGCICSSRRGFVIGRRTQAWSDYFFNGFIDDLRIYNRALSVEEVYELYREVPGYHLLRGSPCIDTGDPNFIGNPEQPDISGSRRVVGETIDIGAYEAYGVLAVLPGQLYVAANEDRPNPPDETIRIHNAGGGNVNWRIDYECDWLTVEPNSGITTDQPSQVALRINSSSLAEGTYDCNLVVSDPDSQNNPQIVPVELVVLGPTIELSDGFLQFESPEGSTDPVEHTLGIRNDRGGTLNWQIEHGCRDLTVEPNSGSSSGEWDYVTLTADMSGVGENGYSCNLTVSDAAAENNPQIVHIRIGTDCFPSGAGYEWQYSDWVMLGKPDCWCGHVFPRWRYQCDGDTGGDGQVIDWRVYSNDLVILAESWYGRPGAANLNPCADIDHGGGPIGWRVYSNDLVILANNWQKRGGQLPGDCPRPDW